MKMFASGYKGEHIVVRILIQSNFRACCLEITSFISVACIVGMSVLTITRDRVLCYKIVDGGKALLSYVGMNE